MKKTILKLPLVICLITASCYLYLQKDNDLNNLVIKNIEALAEDEYYYVVIAALASINVNLAFNSEDSVIDLSLTSIMALARGETDICSICGNDVNTCNCDDYGITCDHGSCDGKVCHKTRIIGLVDVRQMGIHILFVYNTQKKSGYFFRTSLFPSSP